MAKRFVPAPLVHPPPVFSSPSSFPPAALLDHPSSSFPISGVNTDFDVELTNLMNRHLHCLPGICFLLWVVLATRPNGINGRPNNLYGKKEEEVRVVVVLSSNESDAQVRRATAVAQTRISSRVINRRAHADCAGDRNWKRRIFLNITPSYPFIFIKNAARTYRRTSVEFESKSTGDFLPLVLLPHVFCVE